MARSCASRRGRGPGKKLIERDALTDLEVFCAAHGLPPETVRRMSYADRAVLQAARARWYEDMVNLIAAGVCRAFGPQEERNGEK